MFGRLMDEFGIMMTHLKKLLYILSNRDHKEISNNIKTFYKTLFKRNFSETYVEKQQFLNSLITKTLNEQYNLWKTKYVKLNYSIL